MGNDVTRRESIKAGIAAAVLGAAAEGRAGAAGAALAAKLNPAAQGLHFKTSNSNKQNTFLVLGTGFDTINKPQIDLKGKDEDGPVNFVTDKDPEVLSPTRLKVRTKVTKQHRGRKHYGIGDLTITLNDGNGNQVDQQTYDNVTYDTEDA